MARWCQIHHSSHTFMTCHRCVIFLISLPLFSANNLNFESNTPLNLNHAMWDGGLSVGMNSLPFLRVRVSSASDADGRGTWMPKKREREKILFDSTSGSGSLPSMWSISQSMSPYLSSRFWCLKLFFHGVRLSASSKRKCPITPSPAFCTR